MTKTSFFALTATVVAGAGLLVPAAPAASEAGTITADFNGDTVADLVVGVPLEDVGTVVDAGAVNVIYGSAGGLTATGNQLWHQGSTGIADFAETGDRFGSTVAVADFNRDGFDDLAVGVPAEDIGTIVDAGAVNVLYGSPSGLTATDNQLWHQDSTDIAGIAEAGDGFGQSLAAANLGISAQADLAIGVPLENVGTTVSAGAVNVLHGSAGGLTATENQLWHQNRTGIADSAETGDRFGSTLAAADFDGDGFDDLAVGVPSEDVGTVSNAGVVNVIYGSAGGLTATDNQVWHQDSTGIAGTTENFDQFGQSLAAANFGGGGQADLAVGVPSEAVGTAMGAGAVNVIYGSAGGLTATENQLWHQNSTGIADAAELGDRFGQSLAAANLGLGAQADLAIGVPFEPVGTVSNAGAVNVIYGSAGGLTATGNQFWNQEVTDIDTAETDEQFGASLAAANFGRSGQADLAIGVPFEDVETVRIAGAVNVIYGSASGLTATGNQFWNQEITDINDTAELDDRFGTSVAAS